MLKILIFPLSSNGVKAGFTQTERSPAVTAVEVAFCRCKWSVFPPQGATGQHASARPNKKHTQRQR